MEECGGKDMDADEEEIGRDRRDAIMSVKESKLVPRGEGDVEWAYFDHNIESNIDCLDCRAVR
jgi:hypothetical protein